MRTDAKIGLAIGGILLLVVILFVWFGAGSRPAPVELTLTPSPSEAPGRQEAEPLDDQQRGTLQDPFASANAPMTAGDEDPADRITTYDWGRILDTGVILNVATQREEPAVTPANTPAAVTDPPSARTTLPRRGDAELFRPPAPGSRPAERDAAPLPSQQPAEPAGARTHTVKSGETFSSIAAAVYGSANYYPHIMRANPEVNERALRPGMVLELPDPAQVRAPAAAEASPGASPAAIDARREYRVQENDSLYRISMRLYGRADRIEQIYELNREQIGPDQNRLRVGMVLRIPEPPTRSN